MIYVSCVLKSCVFVSLQVRTGEGIKLALHVAITAGEMQLMHVGGLSGQWEVLLAGEAMQALGPTAENAPTDHLVV